MPNVIHEGAVKHGDKAQTRRAEPAANIVVLASPADEVLVETVDAKEILARDREIAAAKGGLRRMPDEPIPQCLAVHRTQLFALFGRCPRLKHSTTNRWNRYVARRAFVQP